MSVEAVATRAAEKILPEGVEIFFRLLVLPLGLCFCKQSGGMTKTALPIRFKPAWAGHSNNLYRLNNKCGYWGFGGNGKYDFQIILTIVLIISSSIYGLNALSQTALFDSKASNSSSCSYF